VPKTVDDVVEADRAARAVASELIEDVLDR
jgi:hypothetical protein